MTRVRTVPEAVPKPVNCTNATAVQRTTGNMVNVPPVVDLTNSVK